jgi:hypothetical protein
LVVDDVWRFVVSRCDWLLHVGDVILLVVVVATAMFWIYLFHGWYSRLQSIVISMCMRKRCTQTRSHRYQLLLCCRNSWWKWYCCSTAKGFCRRCRRWVRGLLFHYVIDFCMSVMWSHL